MCVFLCARVGVCVVWGGHSSFRVCFSAMAGVEICCSTTVHSHSIVVVSFQS